ncbi:MAG: hypothetical protein GY936_06845 [Ignavibacteriae bacterium]|nr:hypothetical protein [Ignavibacteriota bacterium]
MLDQKSEKLNQFLDSAKKVETTVKVVSRFADEINNVLSSIIINDGSVLISKFRFIQDKILSEFTKSSKNIISNPTDKELANAKYSITDSFAGISETGSVCIVNDDSMSGSYSLYSQIHIAFLDSQNLLSRPREIFQLDPYKTITQYEDFIFVSGSSATADMGPLVRGVHGPAKLYVIILEE